MVAILARTCQGGLADLRRETTSLAAQGRVLTIRGGDVALRDAPKAQDFRHGRFWSDPYYAGEHHWYPFLTPLVAAAVSKVTGRPVPESFFRAEVGFVALYLAALGLLAFALAGWRGLLFLPVAIWLGALPASNGLYPTEAARGAFCLFLAYAGLVLDGGLSPRRALGLGAAVGVLGLWNGASFIIAALVAAALAVHATARAVRERQPRTVLRWAPLLALGAAIPLLLLFGPELLRHGRLAVPDAARTWMADIYRGGTLGKALTLPLAPRGVGLVLALALFARLAVGRRLGLSCQRRAIPLAAAYLACVLLGHLGFVGADAGHPVLARLARSLLPAPAHTFLSAADACRPAIEALGLAALVELAARLWPAARARVPGALVPALAALAYGLLLLLGFPYRITRFSSSESAAFDRFAQDVGTRTEGRSIFFRYPGRMLQATSLKILKLSVAEYANPYVHAERARAERALDEALRRGDVTAADAVLERYQMAFIMEDPRAPGDPVIRRCGGTIIMQEDGYRLRERVPCSK
jgi:hypothetical protein